MNNRKRSFDSSFFTSVSNPDQQNKLIEIQEENRIKDKNLQLCLVNQSSKPPQFAQIKDEYDIEQDTLAILSFNYLIQQYQKNVQQIPNQIKKIELLQNYQKQYINNITKGLSLDSQKDKQQFFGNILHYIDLNIAYQQHILKYYQCDERLLIIITPSNQIITTQQQEEIQFHSRQVLVTSIEKQGLDIALFNTVRNERNVIKYTRISLKNTIDKFNNQPVYDPVRIKIQHLIDQLLP